MGQVKMKISIYFSKRWKPFASRLESPLGKRHLVCLREVVHCRRSCPGPGRPATPQPSPFQEGLFLAKAGTGRQRPLWTDSPDPAPGEGFTPATGGARCPSGQGPTAGVESDLAAETMVLSFTVKVRHLRWRKCGE